MAVFKCKMCGGSLNVQDHSRIVECEYCGTRQTLPKLENEKTSGLFDRAGDLRRQNEFDKAEALYEQILEMDNTDAEVYWSLVLCKYGIEYVEEPGTGKRIPTIHRAQFTSIFADENFKKALEYADDEQRQLYNEEAGKIEQIQKDIIEISSKEEPFDVFICYKESDENGNRTEDSVIAYDLYQNLTKNGYKVFFSRVTLESKLGTAYEPYIFSALNSAKVMIVIGTKPEYFNAVWVKNEWSRFLKMMKEDKLKTLIPAYKNMNPYALPKEFSYLQAQDMSKLGFMQDLTAGIDKILKSSMEKEKEKTKKSSANVFDFIKALPKKTKIITSVVAAVLVVAIVVGAVVLPRVKKSDNVAGNLFSKKSSGNSSSQTNNTSKIVEPTDADWESLQSNLYVIVNDDFDCETATAQDALLAMYNQCGGFPIYREIFDDEESFYTTDENYKGDPENKFSAGASYGFRKYSVEKVNWILENALNVKAETFSTLKYNDKIAIYEKDGYYYTNICAKDYGYNLAFSIYIDQKERIKDNMFNVTASGCVGSFDPTHTFTATVAAKDIDGKHFWSIYKWKEDIQKVDPAEYEQDTSEETEPQETIYVYEGTDIPDFGYYYNLTGDIQKPTSNGGVISYNCSNLDIKTYEQYLNKCGYYLFWSEDNAYRFNINGGNDDTEVDVVGYYNDKKEVCSFEVSSVLLHSYCETYGNS